MQYIVKTIVAMIIANLPSKTSETMIKIDGFEDIKIYEKICQSVSRELTNRGLTYNIKLAKSKWTYFESNSDSNTSYLQSMKQNDWVATEESITFYRNLHDTNVLIVMGTEDEEDKGGFLNVYTISPEILIKNLEGDYIQIFSVNHDFDDNEQKCINKLYKDLFEFVPFDICKLSLIADSWENQITTIDDFISKFYETLPLWGLPVRREELPTPKQICGKKNLLRSEYNFISRQLFKKLSKTQYYKYVTKINKYKEGNFIYSNDWEGWNSCSVKSFDSFSDVLISYIKGEKISENKDILLSVDFCVTEAVLDIKLPIVDRPEKVKTNVVTGEPLKAFVTSIMYMLFYIKNLEEDFDVKQIVIEIVSAEIVSMFSDTENDEAELQLKNSWRNICWHTNGVLEYITKPSWLINETGIDIVCTNADFFDLNKINSNISNGHVTSASANKVISTVEFKIKGYNSNNELIKIQRKFLEESFQWKFSYNESWLNNFSDICFNEDIVEHELSFIPLGTANKITSLMFSKSEEEFFDIYDESNIKLDYNILDYINKHAKSNDDIVAMFNSLGNKFTSFIISIYKNGFYNCICNYSEKINDLINGYINLGKKLSNVSLQENEKWLLDAFIYSFSIVNDIGVLESDSECCVIPPWHPAALEKLNDQKVFFLDGCLQWWNDNENSEKLSKKMIDETILNLVHMSMIQSAIDIMPTKNQQYYGIFNSFGLFSVYGKNDIKNKTRLKDIIHKDAIFDDDFTGKDNIIMNDNAKMIYDIMENYQKSFSSSYKNISLVFIDPSELQPIIAAIYKFIEVNRETHPDERINIVLKILVKPDNKGGKNYLAYWMDECFAQDENINVKTYLNEWKNKNDIDRLLNGNNDIIFVMELLKLVNLRFIKNTSTVSLGWSQCRFPIIYKPSPVSDTAVNSKRRIEISQPQFKAAYVHTQVARYRNNSETIPDADYTAVREVSIDDEARKLVELLHKKAYWVVCVDSGMDGALLRDNDNCDAKYPIIGFSTGKGLYGQYNLTVTSRKTILETIRKKLQRRLCQLFRWDKIKIEAAANYCLKEAASLDGISLLSAINPKDHNINEFMAYVLTSLLVKESINKSALKIVVHLDSYLHWFESKLEVGDDSKSRPDFLVLNVTNDGEEKLHIDATVVECKTSTLSHASRHKDWAIEQVYHGIKRLKYIFDPNSSSMKRRYWYAQLYRALAFAQVTFSDNTDDFAIISEKLRLILEGNFEIKWSGRVIGYWLDKDGEDIEISDSIIYDDVQFYDVPQRKMQQLLLQNSVAENSFVNQDSIFYDEDEEDNSISEREKEIDYEMKNIFQKSVILKPDNFRKQEDDLSKINDLKEIIDYSENINVESKGIDVEIQENNHIDLNTNSNFISVNLEENIDSKEIINENIQKNDDISLVEEEHYSNQSTLDDVRVLIGKNKMGDEVYWEFGNKDLPNRHLLITGTSGQGKTYSIQTMLYELSKSKVSSVIFDYTEGFRLDQLEKEFTTRMGDKITQHVVKFKGVPINPFKQHEIDIAGQIEKEFAADVASRFANILVHVYDFGEQQFSAIFEATRRGIEKYKDDMNMDHFKRELELLKDENKSAQTVLSKMTPFFYSVRFDHDSNFEWKDILYTDEAETTIYQLTNIDRETQIIITELMLWDMWYYTKKYGSKDKPFVVVLDEAQNLSHKANSPSAMILTEGRKFGWSAWFATQSLKILSDEEVIRLLQAPFKLYFKPTDEEIPKMSKQLDPSNGNVWLTPLKNLKKGQCIVVGDRIRSDGTFGQVKSTITNVTAFNERG